MLKNIFGLYFYYSKKDISGQIKEDNLIIKNKGNIETFKKNNSSPKSKTIKKFNPKIVINELTKFLYYVLMIYITYNNLSVKCIQMNNSSIILKTNITGYVQIISESYNIIPNEVMINDIKYEFQRGYYLNDPESIIKLKWFRRVNNTSNMFQKCFIRI